jgi:uncharacterized membrane protein YgaE (UPF0421/DUF939 family)
VNWAKDIRAGRELSRKSLVEGLIMALEAAICTVVIIKGYNLGHIPGAMWAVVSAVLVLQPAFDQSMSTALIRVVANMLGAAVGSLITVSHGHAIEDICVALAVVIVVGERLRLDKGLRSACASVVIVMMSAESSVLHTGVERAASVAVGCGVALALQLIMQPIVSRLDKVFVGEDVAE